MLFSVDSWQTLGAFRMEFRHQRCLLKRVINQFTNSQMLAVFHQWRRRAVQEKEHRWHLVLDSQREHAVRRVIKNWNLMGVRQTFGRWRDLVDMRLLLESWERSVRVCVRFRHSRHKVRIFHGWQSWGARSVEINGLLARLGRTATHRHAGRAYRSWRSTVKQAIADRTSVSRAVSCWRRRVQRRTLTSLRAWCRGCRRGDAIGRRLAHRHSLRALVTWRLNVQSQRGDAHESTIDELRAELAGVIPRRFSSSSC